MGAYMMAKDSSHMNEALNWIPLVSLSSVMFTVNLAMLTMPTLVISELMPEKVKDFGMTFCLSLLWTFSFITIKFLPLLSDTIKFHGSIFLFAAICGAGALYIFLFVPETKGKNHKEIMELLQ